MVLRGIRRALSSAPIMPRDASFSDSGCNFFQFGFLYYYELKKKVLEEEKYLFLSLICEYIFYLRKSNVYFILIILYIFYYIIFYTHTSSEQFKYPTFPSKTKNHLYMLPSFYLKSFLYFKSFAFTLFLPYYLIHRKLECIVVSLIK